MKISLLQGRTKRMAIPSYRGHISSRQAQIFWTALPAELGIKEVKPKDKAGKTGIPSVLRLGNLDSGLPVGDLDGLSMPLWRPKAYTSKPVQPQKRGVSKVDIYESFGRRDAREADRIAKHCPMRQIAKNPLAFDGEALILSITCSRCHMGLT